MLNGLKRLLGIRERTYHCDVCDEIRSCERERATPTRVAVSVPAIGPYPAEVVQHWDLVCPSCVRVYAEARAQTSDVKASHT